MPAAIVAPGKGIWVGRWLAFAQVFAPATAAQAAAVAALVVAPVFVAVSVGVAHSLGVAYVFGRGLARGPLVPLFGKIRALWGSGLSSRGPALLRIGIGHNGGHIVRVVAGRGGGLGVGPELGRVERRVWFGGGLVESSHARLEPGW